MTKTFSRKAVAWVLLVTMANPYALLPAYALDSDIYLNTLPGSSAAEPNVLVILDTSDSMNAPEPWREYPGAYDSTVEYLWADIERISNTEVTAENANAISTGIPGPTQWSKWGFWAGATLADRRALWTAAKNSANAAYSQTTPSNWTDPGPRRLYRNYWDLSWYYWHPVANDADEGADPRLWSVSFNRFRGYKSEAGGTRGGITYSGSRDYSNRNQCASSLSSIVPSTVFVPSNYAPNAGKYSGTQWKRWNRYRGLDTVNNGLYTITGTVLNGYQTNYLDSSAPPPNTPRSDNTSYGNAPGDWGQPIRRFGGNQYSGWQNLRADLGGFYLVTEQGRYWKYQNLLGPNGHK